jgi:hypothetical protein
MDRFCGSRDCGCKNEACPELGDDEAREYIVDIIVHIFVSEDRRLHPHKHLLRRIAEEEHRPHVDMITALNGRQRKKPTGRAQQELSRLVLSISVNNNLYLNPITKAIHEGHAVYCPEASHRLPVGHGCANTSDYSCW